MYGQGNYFWNPDNWSKLERRFASLILKALKEDLLSAGQWDQIKSSAKGSQAAHAQALVAHLGRPSEGLIDGLWEKVFKLERGLSRLEVWPRDGTTQWDMAEVLWENIVANQLEKGGSNKFVHTLCRKLADPATKVGDRDWRNLINQALQEQRSIVAAQQLNLHYGGPMLTPTEVEKSLFVLEEQVRRCCDFLARWESFPDLAQALLGRTLVPGRKDLDVQRAVSRRQITPDLAWRWNEMSERIVVAMAQHDGERLPTKWRTSWVRRLDRIRDLKDCHTPEERADKLSHLLQLLYFVQTSAPGEQVLVPDFDAVRRVRDNAVPDDGNLQIGHSPDEHYVGGDDGLLDDADKAAWEEDIEEGWTDPDQTRSHGAPDDDDDDLDEDTDDAEGGDTQPQDLQGLAALEDIVLAEGALADVLGDYSLAYQIGLLLKAWQSLRGDFEAQQRSGTELLSHFQACDLFNLLGCEKHRLEAVSDAKLAQLESRLQGKKVSTPKYQSTLATLWPEFTERVCAQLSGKHSDNP